MANSPTFSVSEMDQIDADFRGEVGFYVEDIVTGVSNAHKADVRFPTASACKISVMVELFKQAHEGALALNDRRRLDDNISTHGSGVLSILRDSPELTLLDYCRLMITVSDNIATDQLMGIVGNTNINATLDALGYSNTRTPVTMGRYHYRMVGLDDVPTNSANDKQYTERAKDPGIDYGRVSFTGSLENNVATPREMASLVKRLHAGEIVSGDASAQMIEILKVARELRMIRKYLSPDVEVAQKSGSSGRIKANVGIVYLPTGPLIISAFALATDNKEDGAEAIAQVAKLAVSAVSPTSLVEPE